MVGTSNLGSWNGHWFNWWKRLLAIKIRVCVTLFKDSGVATTGVRYANTWWGNKVVTCFFHMYMLYVYIYIHIYIMYTICFARFMGSCFRSRMKQVHRTLNDIPVATPIISPWQLPWENMYCWLYTIYIYIPLTSHEYSTNISLCPHYTSDSDVHVLFCRKVQALS